MDIERHNHQQIEQLNQRGGRTLSIVDLIQAGTLSVEMAAYAMRAMHQGASLLTGARPGGAGKTTLMAAILNFLPPEVPLITVDGSHVISQGLERSATDPACYLAHEIGSGDWYGYIWGRDVADFFSLIDGNRRVASCLHADTLDEVTGILCSAPLGVPRSALSRVGVVLFMHVARGAGGHQRRVATFWEADGQGKHQLRFEWDAPTDTFRQAGELCQPEQIGRYVQFVRQLLNEGEVEAESVRRKVLAFYRDGKS
jgi:ABC-type cobalamin/Fe3+-siderophores transport system ATPase subunit